MDLGGGFHSASQKTRENFYFILTGQLCIDQSQSSSANHKLITASFRYIPVPFLFIPARFGVFRYHFFFIPSRSGLFWYIPFHSVLFLCLVTPVNYRGRFTTVTAELIKINTYILMYVLILISSAVTVVNLPL